MPELDGSLNHPKTGQFRLASSQMQVAGIRARSPSLSAMRTEPGDSAEEVCEIATGTATLLFKCKCHLKESVLFHESLSADF